MWGLVLGGLSTDTAAIMMILGGIFVDLIWYKIVS